MPRIVLVQPEIPPKTGNIARTCAATRTELHLVGPLGFEISDRELKRAGLDYWPYVPFKYHPDWAQFKTYHQHHGGRWIGFSKKGEVNYSTFQYRRDDWLLFGRETTGLSPEMLKACHTTICIPMAEPGVRSLNLSVSVTIGLFAARQQLNH